jgi:hypothetical protein
MFDELRKYKNKGHFLFKSGDLLRTVSKAVPEMAGVYYIVRLAKNKVDLVYIGKSGKVKQDGSFGDQMLRGRLNNKQNKSETRQAFFDRKMEEENIDALEIYWFVTMDSKNQDIPSYAEAIMMQHYFGIHNKLPLWNTEF